MQDEQIESQRDQYCSCESSGFGGKCSSTTGQTFPGSAMSVLKATLAKAYVLRCKTLHASSMAVIWLPMKPFLPLEAGHPMSLTSLLRTIVFLSTY